MATTCAAQGKQLVLLGLVLAMALPLGTHVTTVTIVTHGLAILHLPQHLPQVATHNSNHHQPSQTGLAPADLGHVPQRQKLQVAPEQGMGPVHRILT